MDSVQFLEGDALWTAAHQGHWSPDLARAAMEAELRCRYPSLEAALASLIETEGGVREALHGILLTHRDGLRSTILKIGGGVLEDQRRPTRFCRWNFACRLEGEQEAQATTFYTGPWQNRNLFRALAHAIQKHFRERHSPYPLERTLLTTGVIEAAMDSRFQAGRRLATPHLGITYEAQDFGSMREMGPPGRSSPRRHPSRQVCHESGEGPGGSGGSDVSRPISRRCQGPYSSILGYLLDSQV